MIRLHEELKTAYLIIYDPFDDIDVEIKALEGEMERLKSENKPKNAIKLKPQLNSLIELLNISLQCDQQLAR